MSDDIKINRVSSQSNMPQGNRPETRVESSELTKEYKDAVGSAGKNKTPWIILGAVVILLIVLGVAFRENIFPGKKSEDMKASTVSSDKYQAVFLTNGQVYFGKVSNPTDEYLTLKDIWYLQVVQAQQPIQGQQPAPAQQQPTISLVKLGNELHGPVDEMHINRTQILFYEDLRDDGEVVKTIMNEKSKQK
jgi:hypothetical protein